MAGGSGGSTVDIPYHAGPGVGHEIGVMLGFMGAMVLGVTLYVIWFQIKNKKLQRKDEERLRMLRSQGLIAEEKPVVDGHPN